MFDLEDLNKNLLMLTRELHQSLGAKRAFFFKGWQNRRLELDVERQRILLNQIQNLGLTAEELAATQAKIFMSSEIRDALISKIEDDIAIAVQQGKAVMARAIADTKRAIDEEQHVEDIARMRKLELERYEMETRITEMRAQAEINERNAKTEKEKEMTGIIREVVDNMNFKDLPPALQTYIISSVFNPNGNQFNDFDMQEQLKEHLLKKAAAESEILHQKANQEKSESKLKEAKSEDRINDLKKEASKK